ncbi:hypothetical protein C1H46_021537 [Malus baccata]|uniref:Uncharacterized protein n=1 Tax=Malus baccata TaxID=106549 RepID=A0A540M287_MALBA|nr:hypothetical protein C1H46_021537 [Malus baccata]
MAHRPMKMIAAKKIEKFMSSTAIFDAMGKQYNQGYRLGLRDRFKIFHRYAVKVDVKGNWATVDYYKALPLGPLVNLFYGSFVLRII